MHPDPITVLVADDHAIVRDGIVAILEVCPDIRVVGTASNGRRAVERVAALRPRVAILDITMPEVDGIEATRQIVDNSPGTSVIVLPMHSNAEHVFHALEAGAKSYLLKEFAGREIADAVRTVNSGRRYLGVGIAEIVAEGVSQRRTRTPLQSLSRREREILKLVADGYSSAEIGRQLSLSSKTVDTYRSRLMQKLHVSDITSLVKFAILHGLTDLR